MLSSNLMIHMSVEWLPITHKGPSKILYLPHMVF